MILRLTTRKQRYVDYGKHKSAPVVVTQRTAIVADPPDAPGVPAPTAQPATWARFLHSGIPKLQADGWQVEIDPSVRDVVLDLSQPSTPWDARFEAQSGDWFDVDVGVQIDGERVPLLPLIVDVLRNMRDGDLPQDDVTYAMMGERAFVLPMERIRGMLQTLVELLDDAKLNALGRLSINKLAALDLAQRVDAVEAQGEAAVSLRNLARRLANFEGIADVPVPPQLHATLRDYQHEGYRWLQSLNQFECGAILADDMGLGKSIQAIAHLLHEHSPVIPPPQTSS